MAKGHFADFFTKGWAGDAQGGGKALAKGLSVIISEFVFEYVLRGVGKALKRVRDGIKASKTFQRVSKTASRANKTMQATPGIGHAMRGVSKAKNATVNSGKYVINKIRKGTGKGAKKMGDLRRKVLDAFGFKRLWLEKEGKYVELWGKFNSEVLLSRTDGKDPEIVTVDSKNVRSRLNRQANERILGEEYTVDGRDGYVISDKPGGNDYSRNLGNKDLDEMYGKLEDAGSPNARRDKISKSSESTPARFKNGIGKSPDGFENHHILTKEIAREFKEFLDEIGFDVHAGKRNGVALPKTEAIRDAAVTKGYKHQNASLHNGSHSEAYKERFRSDLRRRMRQYKNLSRNNPNAAEIVLNRLHNHLKIEKRLLLNGTLKVGSK